MVSRDLQLSYDEGLKARENIVQLQKQFTRQTECTTANYIAQLELYTNLVCLVGIWLVFLGIYQTDTKGKLGWYISVLFFGGNPFFPQKGGHGPLFEGPNPHFEEKKVSRQTLTA